MPPAGNLQAATLKPTSGEASNEKGDDKAGPILHRNQPNRATKRIGKAAQETPRSRSRESTTTTRRPCTFTSSHGAAGRGSPPVLQPGVPPWAVLDELAKPAPTAMAAIPSDFHPKPPAARPVAAARADGSGDEGSGGGAMGRPRCRPRVRHTGVRLYRPCVASCI
jgi:hypothetical protein